MEENFKKLENEFYRIKKLGWIKSLRKGNTGIGYTFETLLGKKEENFCFPDFEGIEIKTKRIKSKSFISLFSANPDGDYLFMNKYLVNKYGYPNKIYKNFKVFNGEICGNKLNNIGYKYKFIINVDRKKEKINLKIYDRNGKYIEDIVSWSFKMLQDKLNIKLKNLVLIKAQNIYRNNEEYFKYIIIKMYKFKNFEIFLNLIKKGIIRISFDINIYTDEKNFGKIHDRGTSFKISENDLTKLFTKIN